MISSRGTTYYVSSSEGLDSNDGLSKKSPWRSFENLKELALSEGDRILLKRGDEWNERLTICGKGSAEHWITVGAYGSNTSAKPVISLNGERDDICVVVTDILAASEKICGLGYIVIENITIKKANVGIYVRTLASTDNKGLIIRNIEAYDIFCDSQLNRMGHSCTLDEYIAMKSEPQGDLPYIDKSLQFFVTGGGAGEFMFSTAILISGTNAPCFCSVEIYSNIMYNCIAGIEIVNINDVSVHDNIITGSYAGIFRASLCKNADIYRNRILGGSELYTFFGGTCGGFAAVCENIDVYNNEFAYEYNMGENDGTGFDYEAYCKNATLTDNVFHHNDAGGVLIMANKDTQHENVLLENNLFYSNLVNPKNASYCYDIYFSNQGENNMFFKNMHLYTPSTAKGFATHYYGRDRHGYGGTVFEGNITESLDSYRSRFSFNKPDCGEGFKAETGVLSVSGGKALLTADGGFGAMILSLPQNGFCYNIFTVSVTNNARGSFCCRYTDSKGSHMSKTVKVDGAKVYQMPLSDEPIAGYFKDFTLMWEPSTENASAEIDFAQFTPDIEVLAEKTRINEITLTFTGNCFPVLALEPSKDDISIAGYDVASVERIGYNTLKVSVSGTVDRVKNLEVTVKGALFIEYFADMINGVDMERTATDDAALLGCEVQEYNLAGHLTLKVNC